MSARIRQVTAGAYKVGEILDGFRITSFGREWTLDNEDNCVYGAEPWQSVRVCYAYGEPVSAAIAAAPPAENRVAFLRSEIERLDAIRWLPGQRTKVNKDLRSKIDVMEAEIATLTA